MTSRRQFLDRGAIALCAAAAGHSAWGQPAASKGGTLRIGSQGMRTLNSSVHPANFTGVPAALFSAQSRP